MSGPPILAVDDDDEVLPADPLADDSSDEDEAAVEGEVVLAAGELGFDAGPLVLRRHL